MSDTGMATSWIRQALIRFGLTRQVNLLFGKSEGALPATSLAPTFDEVADRLAAELDRARRYEHSLSVVVLSTTSQPDAELRPVEPGQNGQGVLPVRVRDTAHLLAILGGAALRETIRESDIVCHDPATDRLLVALAESGVEEGRQAVERICRLMEDHMGLKVRAGLAQFPDDGLTLDSLIGHAHEAWMRAGGDGNAASAGDSPAPGWQRPWFQPRTRT
jgi:hypothetical protein